MEQPKRKGSSSSNSSANNNNAAKKPAKRTDPQYLSKAQLNEQTYYDMGVKAWGAVSSLFGQQKPDARESPYERAELTFSAFETLSEENSQRNLLLLGYSNGFQIWDVTSLEKIKELVSWRKEGYSVRCLRLVPEPASETPNLKFVSKFPLVAIALFPGEKKEGEQPGHRDIHLFSLKENKVIQRVGIGDSILNILCSEHIIAAITTKHIIAFNPLDPAQIEKLKTFPCVPRQEGETSPLQAPAALNRRWLAYPGAETVPFNDFSQSTTDKIVGMKHGAIEGIGILRNKLGEYYASSKNAPNPAHEPKSNSTPVHLPMENAGTVIIYDVVSKKKICHFQAHVLPIQYLKFDPTGTLLITASQDGQNFNIFKLNPNSQLENSKPIHLYKLNRSNFSSASIQDISFSPDSRWVSVTSRTPTSHIFAINPWGGVPTTYSHVRPTTPPQLQEAHLRKLGDPPKELVLYSLGNIKPPDTREEFRSVFPCCTFVGHPTRTIHFLSVDQFGMMCHHSITPHGQTPAPNVNPITLGITIQPVGRWDIVQKVCSWDSLAWSSKDPRAPPQKAWPSQIEYDTHNPYLQSLPLSQFTFQTLVLPKQRSENPIQYESVPSKSAPLPRRRVANLHSSDDSDVVFPAQPLDNQDKQKLLEALNSELKDESESQEKIGKDFISESLGDESDE